MASALSGPPPSSSRTMLSEQPRRGSGQPGRRRSVPHKSLKVVIANIEVPGGTKPTPTGAYTPPLAPRRIWPTAGPCDSSLTPETPALVGGQASVSTPCPESQSGRLADGATAEGMSLGPRCRFDLDADDILCLSPISSDDSGCAADVTDLSCSLGAPEAALPPRAPSVGASGEGDDLQDEGYKSHQEAPSSGAISTSRAILKSAPPTAGGREADWHIGELQSPAQPQVGTAGDPGQSKRRPSRSPHRPVAFSDDDWQRGKRQYVDTVYSHSGPALAGGAVEELYKLIGAVGQQGAASSDTSWQHPADLTRRNYGKNRYKPWLSLDQWHRLNSQVQRRFASVPPQFQRSPVL